MCGSSLAGVEGSNLARGMDVFLSQVLCVVTYRSLRRGRSIVRRNPTDCGASECQSGLVGTIRFCRAKEKKKTNFLII